MFKASLNKEDLTRIRGKLNKLTRLNDPSSLVYKYRLKILNEYVEVIADLMGRVSADGGFVTCYFLGDTASADWKELSDATKAIKQSNNWKMEIWEASGATRKALLNSINISKGTFAGVQRSGGGDDDPYTHAKTAEELNRPLFSLVSGIFADNKARIEHEILNLIRYEIGWGK